MILFAQTSVSFSQDFTKLFVMSELGRDWLNEIFDAHDDTEMNKKWYQVFTRQLRAFTRNLNK